MRRTTIILAAVVLCVHAATLVASFCYRNETVLTCTRMIAPPSSADWDCYFQTDLSSCSQASGPVHPTGSAALVTPVSHTCKYKKGKKVNGVCKELPQYPNEESPAQVDCQAAGGASCSKS